MILSHNPDIARRQLGVLGRQGLRPASKPVPGRKLRTEKIPTLPPERRSHPNRPGGPRLTAKPQPRTFQQSMRLLHKMMESA